jgi:hypothetical protein
MEGFLLKKYASSGIVVNYTERCVMRNRKPRIDAKDITGMKFGDLTALYINGNGKYRGSTWLCKCDCGNECEAYGGHLRDGTRKSCGCRSEKRIFETGINLVFSLYKRMAKRRNLVFDLSREELEKIVVSHCNYCGSEPGNEIKRKKTKKTQIKYNGIDRFDPQQGYVIGNCVPCCYYCNHAKADFSYDQWLLHLKKIFNRLRITDGI